MRDYKAEDKPHPRGTDSAPRSAADRRREDTLTRLRNALLEERLAVLELSDESTGTDPYNSGIRRGPHAFNGWGKRSR